MYDPRSLRRLGPLPDRPLPHLIRAGGEETAQIQHLPHRGDDLGKRGLGAEFLALVLGFGLGLEAREAFFEGDGERDDGVPRGVLFDPVGDFGEVFVFLPDVVFFAEVDEEDDGFGGEEEERVYDFDLDIRNGCLAFWVCGSCAEWGVEGEDLVQRLVFISRRSLRCMLSRSTSWD